MEWFLIKKHLKRKYFIILIFKMKFNFLGNAGGIFTGSKGSRILSKDAPTLVIHGQGEKHDPQLPDYVEHISVKSNHRGLDLDEVMKILSRRCCNEILVESGSRLAGSLLCNGLLDELIIYVAPTFLGSEGLPLLELSLTKMTDRVQLEIIERVELDDNFRLTVVPKAKLED